jgi:N-acetylglucosamine-6-phosphate deacetylase
MRGLHHRVPGLIGALLAAPVACGLIADGLHVHPAILRLVVRLKGADRLTLVSDAMAALGLPPGTYRLAGRPVTVDGASARLADGTLAGALLTLDAAVRRMLAAAGCTPAEALTMATATPARLLGLPDQGRLAPGCLADIAVLDPALRVTHTFIGGRLASEARATP